MDLGSVVSFLGAASGGTLIGAVGGLISKGVEMYQSHQIALVELEKSKAQFVHDEKMQELQNKTLEMEISANLKSLTTEAQINYDKASFDAMQAAFNSDKATYATGDTAKNSPWFIFVDVVRGITRPFLTWGLDIAALVIVGYLLYILKDQLPVVAQQKGFDLLVSTVDAIMFMASTATTYWFASRPHTNYTDGSNSKGSE